MPAFENADEEAIQRAIAVWVGEGWNDEQPGARHFRGECLFVAHEVTMEQKLEQANAGSLGLAIEKKVGNVSVRYSEAQIERMGDDWLKNSGYGVAFDNWRRSAGIGAVAV